LAWFQPAVYSSGAVSPTVIAIATRRPVMMPGVAVLSTIFRSVHISGMPSASAPSQ
jgi:hypothetical protein